MPLNPATRRMPVIAACESPLYSDIGFKPAGVEFYFPENSVAGWGRKTARVKGCLADGYDEPALNGRGERYSDKRLSQIPRHLIPFPVFSLRFAVCG
jgi:hypothetical protein